MTVGKQALSRGENFDLTEADIERMVHQGAPVTHPRGNVRYMEYWFHVIRGHTTSMGVLGDNLGTPLITHTDAIDCIYCDGTMKTVMINDDETETIIPCRRMKERELPVCDL